MTSIIILNGNVGREPEVRYTPQGKCVANFSVATSESWKDRTTNEWTERTDWHNCVCFDKLGERAAKQIKKGKPIFCTGQISYKHAEKNGVKHVYTTIKVTDFRITEHPPKSVSVTSRAEASQSESDTNNFQPPPSIAGVFDDDDMPF